MTPAERGRAGTSRRRGDRRGGGRVRARVGLVGAAASALAVVAIVAAQAQDLQLTVTHRARALVPGEVVVLRTATSGPAESVEGRSPSGDVRFFRTSDPLVWEALVGLDLDTPTGPFRIEVRAAADGRRVEQPHVLTVVPKTFPSRRITVAPEFATPPAAVLARIQRDAARVGAVWAAPSPERLWTGPFVRPVPGAVTSPFGGRSFVNGQPRSPHGGVDLRAAEGAPVHAPNGGRIVLSDDLYYSGETVIIDHGLGLFSYLGHLSKRTVVEGVVVDRGDLVGLAGATGRVTGPHLHWTVRLGGARVDPMSLLALLGA